MRRSHPALNSGNGPELVGLPARRSDLVREASQPKKNSGPGSDSENNRFLVVTLSADLSGKMFVGTFLPRRDAYIAEFFAIRVERRVPLFFGTSSL